MTITALLPPSSRIALPDLLATPMATRSPSAHEPVAWMSGTRGSATSASPTVLPPPMIRLKTRSASVPFVTSW